MLQEDITIAQVYIYVNMDVIVGSNHVTTLYLGQVFKVYKERKPINATLRKNSCIETWLKLILNECARFFAYYKTIDSMRRSSALIEDKTRLEKALFNKVNVKHPRNDVGPAFIIMDAWEIYRDLPKFPGASTMLKSHASELSQERDGFSKSNVVEGTEKEG